MAEEPMPIKERKFTSAFLPEEMASSFKDKRLTMIDKEVSFGELRNTEERDLQKFCTGSKYIGKWNALGPAERGIYRFPHGVIYDGQFDHDGEFHGAGALIYPNGHRVDALWKHGKLYSQQILSSNNEAFLSSDYCRMPDRRFQIEIESDLRPAPFEYQINSSHPPASIPEGFYYTDEGYYGPKFKAILSYDELGKESPSLSSAIFESSNIDPERRAKLYQINRTTDSDKELFSHLRTSVYEQKMKINSIPSKPKEKWIIKHCRRALDKNVGYVPELYEYWTSGTQSEKERLINVLSEKSRKTKSDAQVDDICDSQSLTDVPEKVVTFIQKPSSLQNILFNLKQKTSRN